MQVTARVPKNIWRNAAHLLKTCDTRSVLVTVLTLSASAGKEKKFYFVVVDKGI